MRIKNFVFGLTLYLGVQVWHGPTTWPWWRRFSLTYAKVTHFGPSVGYRLWFYTRKHSGFFEITHERISK